MGRGTRSEDPIFRQRIRSWSTPPIYVALQIPLSRGPRASGKNVERRKAARGCQGREVLRDGYAEISTLAAMRTRGFKNVFREGRKPADFPSRNNSRNIVSS